jgi:hypothetical protein
MLLNRETSVRLMMLLPVIFVDHTDQGDKNKDSLKAMIKMMHDMFPDMKM